MIACRSSCHAYAPQHTRTTTGAYIFGYPLCEPIQKTVLTLVENAGYLGMHFASVPSGERLCALVLTHCWIHTIRRSDRVYGRNAGPQAWSVLRRAICGHKASIRRSADVRSEPQFTRVSL